MTRRAPRVAVVTSNFWPEPTGTSQTVSEFVEYLAARGVEVRVATSMPYYPQWRIWEGYEGRLWKTERRGGTLILRSWHFVRPRPSVLGRLLHEATLLVTALPNMIRAAWRCDTAFVVSPALSFAFVASVVVRALRKRLVLVVKDIMPDAAVELGMLSNRTVIAVSRWMARSAYWLADEIHTLGEGMKRRIARELGGASKIRLVHDTVDGNELSPVPREENEFRLRFVPDGTFAILHTGNMGQKQDLDLLLRAAARLRDDRGYHFYVFGDGAVRDGFLAKRAAMGLANVSHYPLQERAFLRHMLSGADVVLVSQQPEVIDIVVPSKLITAMAAGAMIVAAAAAESETAKLVAGCEGGVVIPPSDEAALVYILQRIRACDVDVWGCRRRARAFALREFERGCVYGPIVEELCRSGVARFEG